MNETSYLKSKDIGLSLAVQWLRLHAPNAGGPGSIPGGGTRSHMPQLRVPMQQLKIPHATTKRSRTRQQRYRMLQLRSGSAK